VHPAALADARMRATEWGKVTTPDELRGGAARLAAVEDDAWVEAAMRSLHEIHTLFVPVLDKAKDKFCRRAIYGGRTEVYEKLFELQQRVEEGGWKSVRGAPRVDVGALAWELAYIDANSLSHITPRFLHHHRQPDQRDQVGWCFRPKSVPLATRSHASPRPWRATSRRRQLSAQLLSPARPPSLVRVSPPRSASKRLPLRPARVRSACGQLTRAESGVARDAKVALESKLPTPSGAPEPGGGRWRLAAT
jgi:hypothetical protein